MNHTAVIHWDDALMELHLDLSVKGHDEIIHADIFDHTGKLIANVADKVCTVGEHRFIKKIENLPPGVYLLKTSATEHDCNVIRFAVHAL